MKWNIPVQYWRWEHLIVGNIFYSSILILFFLAQARERKLSGICSCWERISFPNLFQSIPNKVTFVYDFFKKFQWKQRWYYCLLKFVTKCVQKSSSDTQASCELLLNSILKSTPGPILKNTLQDTTFFISIRFFF